VSFRHPIELIANALGVPPYIRHFRVSPEPTFRYRE
jgi:hypothetical protein